MINFRSALLVLALITPATAAAQSIPSSLRYIEETQSLGAFGGYLFTDRGEDGLGPESAPLFGASYTIRFAGPLSGEVTAGAAPSNRIVYQRVEEGTESSLVERGETSALLVLGDATLKFNFTGPRAWKGIAPYALGGVGMVLDLSDAPEIEAEFEPDEVFDFGPAFAVVVGAGTDWFPSERLALRVDLRDRLWRLTTPAGLTASGGEESSWTNNISVTLGAALYF